MIGMESKFVKKMQGGHVLKSLFLVAGLGMEIDP